MKLNLVILINKLFLNIFYFKKMKYLSISNNNQKVLKKTMKKSYRKFYYK